MKYYLFLVILLILIVFLVCKFRLYSTNSKSKYDFMSKNETLKKPKKPERNFSVKGVELYTSYSDANFSNTYQTEDSQPIFEEDLIFCNDGKISNFREWYDAQIEDEALSDCAMTEEQYNQFITWDEYTEWDEEKFSAAAPTADDDYDFDNAPSFISGDLVEANVAYNNATSNVIDDPNSAIETKYPKGGGFTYDEGKEVWVVSDSVAVHPHAVEGATLSKVKQLYNDLHLNSNNAIDDMHEYDKKEKDKFKKAGIREPGESIDMASLFKDSHITCISSTNSMDETAQNSDGGKGWRTYTPADE